MKYHVPAKMRTEARRIDRYIHSVIMSSCVTKTSGHRYGPQDLSRIVRDKSQYSMCQANEKRRSSKSQEYNGSCAAATSETGRVASGSDPDFLVRVWF